MKKCNNCNVNLEDSRVNCPLCGKCVDDNLAKSDEKEKCSAIYPRYNADKHYYGGKRVCDLLIKILFMLGIIILLLDLMTNKTLTYSILVCGSMLYVYLVSLRPIKKRMILEKIFNRLIIYTGLFVLFLELITKSWGWGICIVLPSIYIVFSIVFIILFFAKGAMNYDVYIPFILMVIILAVSSILLIVFNEFKLITIISFLIALAGFLFIFLYKFKKGVKGIHKNFRI